MKSSKTRRQHQHDHPQHRRTPAHHHRCRRIPIPPHLRPPRNHPAHHQRRHPHHRSRNHQEKPHRRRNRQPAHHHRRQAHPRPPRLILQHRITLSHKFSSPPSLRPSLP